MPKVLVIVPFALDEEGVNNRRAQQKAVKLGPDIEFDYKPVTAGPAKRKPGATDLIWAITLWWSPALSSALASVLVASAEMRRVRSPAGRSKSFGGIGSASPG